MQSLLFYNIYLLSLNFNFVYFYGNIDDMNLQKGDIEYLANLARINVKDDEKDTLAEKIEAVLNYVSEISKVDTSDYAHSEAGDNRNVLREDTVISSEKMIHDAILNNVPERHGDYVKVQKMFD